MTTLFSRVRRKSVSAWRLRKFAIKLPPGKQRDGRAKNLRFRHGRKDHHQPQGSEPQQGEWRQQQVEPKAAYQVRAPHDGSCPNRAGVASAEKMTAKKCNSVTDRRGVAEVKRTKALLIQVHAQSQRCVTGAAAGNQKGLGKELQRPDHRQHEREEHNGPK